MFAAFLIWSNASTQQRLDETVERFQGTIANMETAHTRAEEVIRARYDSLLAQYNAERATIYSDVVATLAEIRRSLSDLRG